MVEPSHLRKVWFVWQGRPNVSNLQFNTDGSVKNLGGYTVITATQGAGREGIDERVLRLGLTLRF